MVLVQPTAERRPDLCSFYRNAVARQVGSGQRGGTPRRHGTPRRAPQAGRGDDTHPGLEDEVGQGAHPSEVLGSAGILTKTLLLS